MSTPTPNQKYTYPEGATKEEKRKIRRAARKAAQGKITPVGQAKMDAVLDAFIDSDEAIEIEKEPYPEDEEDDEDEDLLVTKTKAEWKELISDLTDEDLADEISDMLPSSFGKAASTKKFTLELTEEQLAGIS